MQPTTNSINTHKKKRKPTIANSSRVRKYSQFFEVNFWLLLQRSTDITSWPATCERERSLNIPHHRCHVLFAAAVVVVVDLSLLTLFIAVNIERGEKLTVYS